MKKEMSRLEEHDAVVWYVLERPLVRPNTSYKRVAFYILIFLLGNISGIVLLYFLFRWLGISSFLPQSVYSFYTDHHTTFIIFLIVVHFFISGIISLKSAIIGAVRLYQHYAPEYIRRKCLCKPTCSEYTILVIEKYGVVRGLYKSYIRLFKKCRGRIYRIDEP